MKLYDLLFNQIDKCPICSSEKRLVEGKSVCNRYSEEIAKILNTTEEDLIDNMLNLRCINCNVGYKNIWFKQGVYYKVFIESSPYHPQGWDSLSDSFTAIKFIENISTLQKHFNTPKPLTTF
jgi:hypothetical protein